MVGPGQKAILAGKYRLVRQLGRGGMGSVWYAEHLTLHAPVAIKLMDPEIARNAESLQRFMHEAQAAATLRSPHVVQVLDHGVDDGVPFIAMELLEGESLADRLNRRDKLTPVETSRIVTQIGRALTRAHEAGIIHRDLKPENVFLVRNDEEEVAKILDFGVAKSTASGLALSAAIGTQSGIVLGTPFYMSPEQAEGKRNLDHRTDVWALGVIAFECLVGRLPFEGETIGTLFLAICARRLPIPSEIGDVPPGFDEWFANVCARDPDERIASAKMAAAELRRICEGGAGTSLVPESAPFSEPSTDESAAPVSRERVGANSVVGFSSSHGKGRAPFRRRSGRRFALAIIAGALVIGGAYLSWKRWSPPPVSFATGDVPVPSGMAGARSLDPAGADPQAAVSSTPVPPAPPVSSTATAPPSAPPTTASPSRKVRNVVRPPSPKTASSAPPARPKVNFGF